MKLIFENIWSKKFGRKEDDGWEFFRIFDSCKLEEKVFRVKNIFGILGHLAVKLHPSPLPKLLADRILDS